MTTIHPTAIVEDGAQLGADVVIGAYCCVGPEVVLGDRIELKSHVVVAGQTTIGAGTRIFPFSSIGHIPQDLKYAGEKSTLVVGANNTIREHVTMNPGTTGGGMETRVGDNNLFMVGAHVAHDCHVGNYVIFANNATLAGHVTIEDFAILGGLVGIHQFVRIGAHAMIGGMTGVEGDIIPFASAIGNRAHLSGLNVIGLKRRGFSRDDIHTLRNAYKALFADAGTMSERVDAVDQRYGDCPPVKEIIAFIRADSSRALCQPTSGDGG